jgi:hypothetical protein
VTTTRIYADSIREARCRGRNCYRPIFFAQLVDGGTQMPFEVRPVPLEVQGSLLGGREIWVVDLAHNHWPKCPNATQFRRGHGGS